MGYYIPYHIHTIPYKVIRYLVVEGLGQGRRCGGVQQPWLDRLLVVAWGSNLNLNQACVFVTVSDAWHGDAGMPCARAQLAPRFEAVGTMAVFSF